MIEPYNKNIKWLKKSDLDMSLISMIDLLYKGELIEDYSEPLCIPRAKNDYAVLYEKHNSLMNDVVVIICGTGVLTPSNINKENTNEYHLFIVINRILELEWFYKLQATATRGYEKEKRKYDAAWLRIQRYSSDEVPYQFPLHKTEIIHKLQDYFTCIKRPEQEEKVINAIKKHFGIDKISHTKREKIIIANRKMVKFLEEEGVLHTVETSDKNLK